MCGANVALCLPRRSTAAWVARRPSTTSCASMTCHLRTTSPALGLYVRMLYYLLLLVFMLETTGAAFGAGDELYLSCGGGSKWPQSPA
jgi:hypothetical protein